EDGAGHRPHRSSDATASGRAPPRMRMGSSTKECRGDGPALRTVRHAPFVPTRLHGGCVMRMPRWLLVVACLFLVGCGSAPSEPSAKMPSVDVTAKWLGTYATIVGAMPVELALPQTDASVTGNA